jgi:hypothetical protein
MLDARAGPGQAAKLGHAFRDDKANALDRLLTGVSPSGGLVFFFTNPLDSRRLIADIRI